MQNNPSNNDPSIKIITNKSPLYQAISLSLKYIKLLLDSLPHSFGVDKDLSLSKDNMKDILYIPLYKKSLFSLIF
ncbi:hypothetical protein H8356DRAFT_1336635 [Neocallimastix lanati (nom. inval.)]|nr:hypothetical protein H8356DRAFT_1336635 [Neocallimastix sp. JGI-2020a]